MYLKQTPQGGGRVSLSIAESWWDPGKGRSRQRTVENLGHLDALAAEHADRVLVCRDGRIVADLRGADQYALADALR